MSILGSSNAIGWAHFQLRGGWKTALSTAAAYMAVVGGLALTTSFLSFDLAGNLRSWLSGLLVLQGAILLLFGSWRISESIRNDVGGMLESHRLMPTTPLSAVLGYIFGPTLQAVALALGNFIVGIICASFGNLSLDGWLTANLVMAVFALLMWSMTTAMALVSSGAIGLTLLVVMTFWLNDGSTTSVFPAIAVLAGPAIGRRAAQLNADLSWSCILSMLLQIGLAVLWVRGAMRRYISDSVSLLGVALGLILLAAWVGLSLVGMRLRDNFVPPFMLREIDDRMALLLTLIATPLVALIPLSNGLRDWIRPTFASSAPSTISIGGSNVRPRRLPPLALIAIVTVLALMPPLGLTRLADDLALRWVLTSAVVILFLLSMSYLLRWLYLSQPRAMPVGLVWLGVTALLPILADQIHQAYSFQTGRQNNELGWIAGLSPVGALIEIWQESAPQQPIPGLIVQALLAAMLALLFHITRRARIRSAQSTAV